MAGAGRCPFRRNGHYLKRQFYPAKKLSIRTGRFFNAVKHFFFCRIFFSAIQKAAADFAISHAGGDGRGRRRYSSAAHAADVSSRTAAPF